MYRRLFIAVLLGWGAGACVSVFGGENHQVAESVISPTGLAPADSQQSRRDQDPPARSALFELKRTVIAPLGAEGSAELKSNLVTLHLTHLQPGRYELKGFQPPYRSYQLLGTIVLVDPTASPDRQANDNKKEASAGPDQVYIQTDTQIALPPDLLTNGITRLELLNAGGNTVLAGDAK